MAEPQVCVWEGDGGGGVGRLAKRSLILGAQDFLTLDSGFDFF